MPITCSECNCADIETDDARGSKFCKNCGAVLESDIIVSEVRFEESSSGSSSVIGQFLSNESTGIRTHGIHGGHNRDSRTLTIENGRRRLQNLASQLRLRNQHIDMAVNIYKMVVKKKWTQGRRINVTTAACLYMVCRMQNTAHMLLDFSDILQINVYTLGHAYLQLAKTLQFKVPSIDPALYIPRFAEKLDFGDKKDDICHTALRLLQRMQRDWMSIGRRPSGLCGAALLVSARIHDYQRTIGEIVQVVKISEASIRKRLHEFGKTASGDLTVDDFFKVDLEQESDPPCFSVVSSTPLAGMDDSTKANFVKEILEMSNEIDRDLEQVKPKRIQIPGLSSLLSELYDKVTGDETLDEVLEKVGVSFGNNMDAPWDNVTSANVVQGPGPSLDSLGLRCEDEQLDNSDIEDDDGELDLDGINEDEIDSLILTDDEALLKSRLWLSENKDWLLKERQRLELKRKKLECSSKYSGLPKSKRPKGRTSRGQNINKHIERLTAPVSNVLSAPKVSSKLNYVVLKDLECPIVID